jgi:acyl carrier protein
MKSITDILAEIRPEADFKGSSNYIDDGLLDSFDLVTLVAALEETYSIRIDGLDIVPENFSSIAAIEALTARSKAAHEPKI